ncbi:uncharacterized protein HMPREF1541_03787 [Cyphellophora europaea CBS 101466]|uniref:Uncharacterized protein n=1 Tax=Cyphellophora europaea (strain CBS 101466) TaxID=1220924 RepID=W2S1B8_CYPE1|nr:uncharacterized protein HMPREF1541_03787 [Cyphellophora europaea CBS 101466]ETN41848.1 hypothetical protein HMPREF1541_03787 [Cyphellophora europaea CBS 101466]
MVLLAAPSSSRINIVDSRRVNGDSRANPSGRDTRHEQSAQHPKADPRYDESRYTNYKDSYVSTIAAARGGRPSESLRKIDDRPPRSQSTRQPSRRESHSKVSQISRRREESRHTAMGDRDPYTADHRGESRHTTRDSRTNGRSVHQEVARRDEAPSSTQMVRQSTRGDDSRHTTRNPGQTEVGNAMRSELDAVVRKGETPTVKDSTRRLERRNSRSIASRITQALMPDCRSRSISNAMGVMRLSDDGESTVRPRQRVMASRSERRPSRSSVRGFADMMDVSNAVAERCLTKMRGGDTDTRTSRRQSRPAASGNDDGDLIKISESEWHRMQKSADAVQYNEDGSRREVGAITKGGFRYRAVGGGYYGSDSE